MKKLFYKNTIFLVIEHGFQAKNILRTNIFDQLKNSNFQIVILSPVKQNKEFKLEFSGKNIHHEFYNYDQYSKSRIFSIFHRINLLSFNSKYFKIIYKFIKIINSSIIFSVRLSSI